MSDREEVVHVHKMDVKSTVAQYEKDGFILADTQPPSINTQKGFVKLVFKKVQPEK